MSITKKSGGLYVIKRNGESEHVNYSKINTRIKYLVEGILPDGERIEPSLDVDYDIIVRDVIASIKNNVTTHELDTFAARHCATKVHDNYNYGILAGRIAISDHNKSYNLSFSEMNYVLYTNIDTLNEVYPLIKDEYYLFVQENAKELDAMCDYRRDFNFDYFGFNTLKNSYLLKAHKFAVDKEGNRYRKLFIERCQHLYMRVAVALYMPHLDKIKNTYDLLTKDGGYVSMATPILFNSMLKNGQLASCFLVGMKDSLLETGGIADMFKELTAISKFAGGIGLCMDTIRGEGSSIRTANGGVSDGCIPICKIVEHILSYVDQNKKRAGSCAIYFSPWHPDVKKLINLKKNHGIEKERARDLFLGMMIPDIFMKRLEYAYKNDVAVPWSLICPHEHRKPGYKYLYDLYGEEFEKIYCEYESEGLVRETIPDIRKLWVEILVAQQETGVPYILYKDHINRKNNQSNLGTIRCSNLCAEIVEYSDHEETAVCNLSSIVLQRFFKPDGEYDYELLKQVSYQAICNLDRVIDTTFYPSEKSARSNNRHRPLGLGVQGLADVFMIKRFPFESAEAKEMNKKIFETIYYGAMQASADIARDRELYIRSLGEVIFPPGDCPDDIAINIPNFRLMRSEYNRPSHVGSYSSFIGSPLSHGLFQFDLWPTTNALMYDWEPLREQIKTYGARHSLVCAVAPTASTASILHSTECIEPIKYNLYTRRILAGEYIIINSYLQKDLIDLGLWTPKIKNDLIANRGSIQTITDIPENIRELYKTVYEMKQRNLMDMSADRSRFICQTTSSNLYFKDPSISALTSAHIYAFGKGLKTSSYYIRRFPKLNAIQFTVDTSAEVASNITTDTVDESEGCASCSA